MSLTKFKEAKDNLSFSQGLVDRLHAQSMAQQSPEMGQPEGQPIQEPTQAPEQPTEVPQAPQDAPGQEQPQEPTPEPTGEPKKADTADELMGVIKDMVETDRLEEERKIKELETQHEDDLKTITDRVRALFKRGKKK